MIKILFQISLDLLQHDLFTYKSAPGPTDEDGIFATKGDVFGLPEFLLNIGLESAGPVFLNRPVISHIK